MDRDGNTDAPEFDSWLKKNIYGDMNAYNNIKSIINELDNYDAYGELKSDLIEKLTQAKLLELLKLLQEKLSLTEVNLNDATIGEGLLKQNLNIDLTREEKIKYNILCSEGTNTLKQEHVNTLNSIIGNTNIKISQIQFTTDDKIIVNLIKNIIHILYLEMDSINKICFLINFMIAVQLYFYLNLILEIK